MKGCRKSTAILCPKKITSRNLFPCKSKKSLKKAFSLHNLYMDLLEENNEDYFAVKRGYNELFDSYR